jgi:anti-sigma regulatory factor (Ser/Thr protein kinase)
MACNLKTSHDAYYPAETGDSRRAWHLTLPMARQAPGLAREATREVLTSWQVAHLTEPALLIVSELVTNSVKHTKETLVILQIQTTGTRLRIEVHDADPRWPQPCTPTGRDESGFGLVLVNALADEWGVCDSGTGKAVWAELETVQLSRTRAESGLGRPGEGSQ